MTITLPKIYNQLDPKWKDKTFGAGAKIGDYGCLLTCAAMVCCYFGYEETPVTLASKVNFIGNLWIWNDITYIYPDITFQGLKNTPDPLTKTQMDEIRGIIDKGYPVFLQVDVRPQTTELDEHWVLAVGYNGDDFVIVNPYGGYTHNITDYGIKPQLLIWAYGYYQGRLPVIQNPMDDYKRKMMAYNVYYEYPERTIEDLEKYKKLEQELRGQIDALSKQITEKDKTISTQADNLLNLESSLAKATETIENLEKEVEDKEKLREKWYSLYQQAYNNFEACKKDRATFQGELNKCLKREKEITWGELLLRIWDKIKGKKI